MKSFTLFNENSTSALSDIFTVMPGSLAMISAYGFKAHKIDITVGQATNIPQMGVFQKLAFAGGLFPDGAVCTQDKDVLYVAPPYSYAEDVTQCGLWNVSACQNLVFLSVPGSYRLELNDTEAIGNVYITLTKYYKDEIGFIPHALHLGDVR